MPSPLDTQDRHRDVLVDRLATSLARIAMLAYVSPGEVAAS
jgi:hypothetical protein